MRTIQIRRSLTFQLLLVPTQNEMQCFSADPHWALLLYQAHARGEQDQEHWTNLGIDTWTKNLNQYFLTPSPRENAT
jgi:hypothetical protein